MRGTMPSLTLASNSALLLSSLVWLTACGAAGSAPAAAPQPATMAFVAQTAGVNHIFLMKLSAAGEGTNAIRLTVDAAAENYPSWSPDGSHLAYARDLNGSAIYTIAADGSGERRLSSTPGFDVTPSWSADGTQIVYARLYTAPAPNQPPHTDLRIMSADGTGDHALLTNTLFSIEPRWSSQGQIVFVSMMAGSTLNIFTIYTDGSGLAQLTGGANNSDPVWSPDGRHISFGSDREGGGKLNIVSMAADGSDQTQLTHFLPPVEAGDTNWSSDGSRIAFEYDINGNKQSDPNAIAAVWTMHADGSAQTPTGQPCSDVGCAPRWKP